MQIGKKSLTRNHLRIFLKPLPEWYDKRGCPHAGNLFCVLSFGAITLQPDLRRERVRREESRR